MQGYVDGTLVLYPTFRQYGVNAARIRIGPEGRACSAQFSSYLLDDSVPEDPSTRRQLTSFYESMERDLIAPGEVAVLKRKSAGLDETAFAGETVCASCHEPEARQWRTTSHAFAYKTLLDRHRHFHPRCVGCHVLGFGQPGGFEIGAAETHLQNVQCESCHGPGALHAADPGKGHIRREVGPEVCLGCHDAAHSDAFDYEKKIQAVIHSTVVKGEPERTAARAGN
jgi:predicted CXXCH cytochrome family protein